MNTAQLIILWYAGFLITAILLVGLDLTPATLILSVLILTALLLYTLQPHEKVHKGSVLKGIMVGIGLVAFIGSVIRLSTVYLNSNRPSKSTETWQPATTEGTRPLDVPVPTDQVELVTPQLREGLKVPEDIRIRAESVGIGGFPTNPYILSGRIRNRSEYTVTDIEIEVSVFHQSDKVGGTMLRLYTGSPPFELGSVLPPPTRWGGVPPREARDLDAEIDLPGIHLPAESLRLACRVSRVKGKTWHRPGTSGE